MKRLGLMIVTLLCIAGCARQGDLIDMETATRAVQNEYGDDSLVRAEDDLVRANFGDLDYVQEAAVYYTENADGTEFGFFKLSDKKFAPQMEAVIKEYLKTEREAVESLAALYPAEELSARLARFDNATVGRLGNIVYYCIADGATVKRLTDALR